MKNQFKLLVFLTPLLVGLGLQAEAALKHTPTGPAYARIENKTGGPLRIWWGGHRTLFDKDNFAKVPKGGHKTFWLRDVEAMRGPLFFQQATDAKEYAVKTTNIGGVNYEIIHSVPEAPFYPINEHRGLLNNRKTIEIEPGGAYDFRVRLTWPWTWDIFKPHHPWVKAEANTYNPLTGAYRKLGEVLQK
jgi:hypothetical protein